VRTSLRKHHWPLSRCPMPAPIARIDKPHPHARHVPGHRTTTPGTTDVAGLAACLITVPPARAIESFPNQCSDRFRRRFGAIQSHQWSNGLTRAYPEQPTANFTTLTLVVHSVLIGKIKRKMRYVSVYYTRTRHPNTVDVNLFLSACPNDVKGGRHSWCCVLVARRLGGQTRLEAWLGQLWAKSVMNASV
jgi:hypothetical protein